MKQVFFIVYLFMSFLTNGQLMPNINADSLAHQAMLTKQANKEQAAKQTITHFVMKNADGTYGYSIFIEGNMTYHQPNIPAMSGNKGFEKVEHAEAVAKLAIQKIKEGESPPTVSVEEVERIIGNYFILSG